MFQVCIDTGGTFTDGVLIDEEGNVAIGKVATTPADIAQGIIESITLLGHEVYGMTLNKLLIKTQTVTLGTTVGNNAIAQLKGAKVCMITTKNFRDILEMRRMIKSDLYNLKLPQPVILIPRYLRYPVEERIAPSGEIITPLNETDVRQAVARAKAEKAEVVAVCFLHSYINPEHERKAAEIVSDEYPEVQIVLSSDVLPRPMEFERFSTTALASYIGPVSSNFLKKVDRLLREAGFQGALHIVTCNAAVTNVVTAIKRPILMLSSGPSAGPLLASFLGKEAGYENMISIDMGGTSFDTSVIPKGQILTVTESTVEDQRNAIETVDVVSIGAGGGSIAWLDQRGILCVGPESAGAEPGPACYGKGGLNPTVTDADVLLGYIPADYFLGGRMKLDMGLAEKTLKDQIAEPLGVGVTEAAYAVWSLVNTMAANQIFLECTSRGYDPRDFVICAGGGAGPTHVFTLAATLGMKEIYIPKVAPVFCAFGMAYADFRYEFCRFARLLETEVDLNELNKIYQEMEAEGISLLKDDKVAGESIEIRRGADVCYYGQLYSIEATMSDTRPGRSITLDDFKDLIKDFHKRHQAQFGYSDENTVTRITGIKLKAVGKPQQVTISEQPHVDEDASKALKRSRDVYFKELGGFTEVPCYDGDSLRNGNIITGPAVIEEKTTTIVIPPGTAINVDRFGNYVGKLQQILSEEVTT